MNAVFLDTSYFIALVEHNDDFHSAAVQFSKDNTKALLTSSAIVLELGAAFSKIHRRPIFDFILQILVEENVEIVHVDSELQKTALKRFRDRPDKDWSLTDCTSFLIMERFNIADSATTDIHFEQAEFNALLRSRI